MSNEAKTNILDYLINLKFSKVKRLFVLPLRINEDEDKDDRPSFSEHFTSTLK